MSEDEDAGGQGDALLDLAGTESDDEGNDKEEETKTEETTDEDEDEDEDQELFVNQTISKKEQKWLLKNVDFDEPMVIIKRFVFILL